MPRPRTLSPSKYWHSHAKQFVVKIAGGMFYLGREEAEAERRRCLIVAASIAREPLPTFGRPGPASAPAPSGPTVSEVLLEYERHARARYDDSQVGRVALALDAVREAFGPLPAADFGPKSLKEVRRRLLEQRSMRGGRLVSRIRELLAGGPVSVRDLDARLRAEGWTQPGIQRARRLLGLAGRPGRGGVRVVSLAGPAPDRARLSRGYVNALIGCVQQAWTWLAGEELVPAEKALALRTVTALRAGEGGGEAPQIVAVPPAVVEATLPECGRVVAAMVRVQQLTGCRPSEVCRMRRCDLSCSPAERILVPGTKPPMHAAALEIDGVPVWVYVPESHKTLRKGKRRLVPVGPRAQEILRPFLDGRDPLAFLFSAKEASDELRTKRGRRRKYGRGREPGDCYTPDSYRGAVQRAVERANRVRASPGLGPLPVWAPGQLRKCAATLSDEKADRDTTAALLGHSTPDMPSVYANQALGRAARFVAAYG